MKHAVAIVAGRHNGGAEARKIRDELRAKREAELAGAPWWKRLWIRIQIEQDVSRVSGNKLRTLRG